MFSEPSIMKKINMKKKKKKRVVSAVINDLDDGSNLPPYVDNTPSSYIRANMMNKSASTASQIQVSTLHRTNSVPISQGSNCSGGSEDLASFSFEKSLVENLERTTSENIIQGMIVSDCEKTPPLIQGKDYDEVFESVQKTETEEISFSDKLYMIKALYSDSSVEHRFVDKEIVRKVSELSEGEVTKIKGNDIKLKVDYSELVLKDSFVVVGNDGDELSENDIFQNNSTELNQVYISQNEGIDLKNQIEEEKADKLTERVDDFLSHPQYYLHSTNDNSADKRFFYFFIVFLFFLYIRILFYLILILKIDRFSKNFLLKFFSFLLITVCMPHLLKKLMIW